MKHHVLTCLVTLQAALLAFIVLAASRFSESKVALLDACNNQRQCDLLAKEIRAIRRLASVAEENSVEPNLGNRLLLSIAQKCGIRESQLGSIQRLVPSRIEQTEYQREDVSIEVRNVSMEQIVKLTLEIEQLSGSVKTTSLSLTASRAVTRSATESGPMALERWDAQVILTQLVFVATRANS